MTFSVVKLIRIFRKIVPLSNLEQGHSYLHRYIYIYTHIYIHTYIYMIDRQTVKHSRTECASFGCPISRYGRRLGSNRNIPKKVTSATNTSKYFFNKTFISSK